VFASDVDYLTCLPSHLQTGLRDVLKDSYILNEQIESLTALVSNAVIMIRAQFYLPRSQYKSLETDIRNIRSIIETQAALEFGNCEGLSAWAKVREMISV
jgi:hypothetical protein